MKKLGFIFLFLPLLCACHQKAPEKAPVAVVTEITVTREEQGTVTRQIYTNPEKLRQILTAIRQLGQKFNPSVDPETLPQASFHILLHRSDGSDQIYRTKADRYIRFDHQPWQQTDSESLTHLTELLRHLPGDIPLPNPRKDLPRSTDWLTRLHHLHPILTAPLIGQLSARTG